MKKKLLSLYIHIPFCVRKCNYCDFLSAPADEAAKEAYIQVLLLEIESYRGTQLSMRKVKTIFIGGGTPSILDADRITDILNKIKSVFYLTGDCEISMEMNPGTVTKEKIKRYLNAGINRISIGLQTPDDNLLKVLGRVHTFEEFLHTYDEVREAGFQNVNIDLMAALPGQSIEGYCNDLEKVTRLSPEHISAYSLIVEEGTPFYDMYHSRCDLFPDEQADREMYECTKEILGRNGYMRYEISNYAKEGYECRHNIVYWECEDYLGLGLGSASLIDDIRFKNVCDLKQYIQKWKAGEGYKVQRQEEEVLAVSAQMEEFMFLGLRMMRGVSKEEFTMRFGQSLEQIYGIQIEKLIRQGLLRWRTEEKKSMDRCGVRLALTDRGIDVSNYVFEQFLL